LLTTQNLINQASKLAKRVVSGSKLFFIHGVIILISLTVAEFILFGSLNSFLLYLPPIGFAFFLLFMFIIQPIIIGAINIALIHSLYKFKGWQIDFWPNGLFLFLVFSAINLIFQTITHISYLSYLFAFIEIILLAYPFGIIAKLSNGKS
jgi:hypothetical protein